jgi:hypothetical protein
LDLSLFAFGRVHLLLNAGMNAEAVELALAAIKTFRQRYGKWLPDISTALQQSARQQSSGEAVDRVDTFIF